MSNVYYFDNDLLTVACAVELSRVCNPHDPRWTIDEGSFFDFEFFGY